MANLLRMVAHVPGLPAVKPGAGWVLSGLAVLLAVGAIIVPEAAEPRRERAPEAQAADPLLERARALHRQVPLIDGHNDYPVQLRWRVERDLDRLDISQPQPDIDTDVERLRQGGVGGLFFSAYAAIRGRSAITPPEAVRGALEQIDVIHRVVARYPDTFEQAFTADDMERIFRSGKIGAFIGLEGGHHIDSSLAALRMFYRLGVRYMTLTWNHHTPWADSWFEPPKHQGLTRFGEEVVREMNWLGMLVDIAHVSADTMEDVLQVTEAPVIISHGSPRALADSGRNAPDRIIRMLPANGGVLMVFFMQQYSSHDGIRDAAEQQTERQRLADIHGDDEAAVRAGMEAWRLAHPVPRVTTAHIVDNIDHVRRVAGIDHVGLGSDFDGGANVLGLEDVSKFHNLTVELLRRGYSDEDVKKVLGLNVLRALRGAEAVAERLQQTRPASAALIGQLDR